MSNYYYNNHLITYPPGSIASYIGGGTTTSGTNPGDPDGWVICDGQQRTVTDGRFVNLAAILNTYMGVSTNTSNSIIPPDLKGQFLRGCDSAATTVKGSGGNGANVTLSIANLPPHNHGVYINDPGHYHTNQIYAINNKDFTSGPSEQPPADSGSNANTWQTNSTLTQITASAANTGSGTSFSVLPSYITVNYVMKY